MDPSKAAILAAVTIFGMLMLAQLQGARATSMSLRRGPEPTTTTDPRPNGSAPREVKADQR